MNIKFIQRGWLNGNSVIYDSDKLVIFDTGYYSCRKETVELLKQEGYDIVDFDLIVNTHCHSDHVGANAEIINSSDAKIAMHEYEAYYVNRGDKRATWIDYFDYEVPEYKVDIILKNGDQLNFGNIEMEVIHTPGHSIGGISLYDQSNKVLISGDVLHENDFGIINARVEGSSAIFLLKESLERLRKLDVDVIYPGHGKPIYDAETNFNNCLSRINEFIKDPFKIAYHMLSRIVIFHILRKGRIEKNEYINYLKNCIWFIEMNDLYLKTDPDILIENEIEKQKGKGIIDISDGFITANIEC